MRIATGFFFGNARFFEVLPTLLQYNEDCDTRLKIAERNSAVLPTLLQYNEDCDSTAKV